MKLTLDPHEQIDIAVGNALRVANNRFALLARKHRPYTWFDRVMDDICELNGERWMDER